MFGEFEIFQLTFLDIIESRCVLFSDNFTLENLAQHRSWVLSGLFLWWSVHIHVSVVCFIYLFERLCLFTMNSTHLIYLQKFSDLVNRTVNSISRKRERENTQVFFQACFYRNMPKQWVTHSAPHPAPL